MKTWTLPLGLSLTITVGLWSEPVVAQAVLPPPAKTQLPPTVPEPVRVVVVPIVPYEPSYHPAYPLPLVPPPPPIISDRPCQRCLNAHGMACEANPNGTGNFHSHMMFTFGSSRAFFGETCVPNPPHPHRWWR